MKAKIKTASGKEIEISMAAGKWQAVCTGAGLPLCSHVGSWFGPERDTEDEAIADKNAHKQSCSHHNPEVVRW
jgi:hypothetical protein